MSPPSHWVVALPREEEKLISDPPGVSFLSLLGLQVSAWLGSAQLSRWEELPGKHTRSLRWSVLGLGTF